MATCYPYRFPKAVLVQASMEWVLGARAHSLRAGGFSEGSAPVEGLVRLLATLHGVDQG